jgi:hypothetical protein
MDYELTWDDYSGFYARITDWLTPETAARLAHAIAGDPRFDSVAYGIVDVMDCPGHRFRRGDANQVALATGEIIGALKMNPDVLQAAICTDQRMLNLLGTYMHLTRQPVHVFPTPAAAHHWLASQSQLLRHLEGRPDGRL